MKQTEIGLIPDDWEIKETKDICNISIGLVTSMTTHYVADGIPLIRNFNILPNRIEKKGMVYLDQPFAEANISRQLLTGDIVTIHTGDVGTSAIIEDDLNGCFGFATIRSRIKKSNISNKYLCVFYNSLLFKNQAVLSSTGDGRQNLNLYDFVHLKVLLPPTIAEQQRIAKALSDVDALISTTEKLIQKKKNIKLGTMQNLLTGKKRLPGFGPQTKSPAYKQTELGPIPDDWEVMSLEEICKRITDGSHESPAEVENGYYMPSVKDMSIRGFDFSECKKISESDYQKLVQNGCKPEIGDVLIAKDGSILKYSFAIEEEMNIVILSSIAILKPNTSFIDSSFLALYFQQEDFIKSVIDNNKTGTGVPRIVLTNFKKINIVIPSKEEQTAIANVLSSMDKEIETLNTKLEKYRNLKTAMMQQLLTGKIRFV